LTADRFNPDAERFRTRATHPAPADETAPTERFAAVGKPSGRRTRRTVDLTPAQHRALDIWQREAADRLGLTRVTGQQVLTALIDQLLADHQLSDRITRAIHARR
jgi:hypothetical protein